MRGEPDPSRYRFEVRHVDLERRVLVHVDDHPTYYIACLCADCWREATREDFVVWDTRERRALYDSRLLPPLNPRP